MRQKDLRLMHLYRGLSSIFSPIIPRFLSFFREKMFTAEKSSPRIKNVNLINDGASVKLLGARKPFDASGLRANACIREHVFDNRS